MLERAHLLRTGRLARPFDEYPPEYLHALLFYGDESDAELMRLARRTTDTDWLFQDDDITTTPPRRRRPKSFDDGAILTGDPVVDEWERALARGEVPDLDARGGG